MGPFGHRLEQTDSVVVGFGWSGMIYHRWFPTPLDFIARDDSLPQSSWLAQPLHLLPTYLTKKRLEQKVDILRHKNYSFWDTKNTLFGTQNLHFSRHKKWQFFPIFLTGSSCSSTSPLTWPKSILLTKLKQQLFKTQKNDCQKSDFMVRNWWGSEKGTFGKSSRWECEFYTKNVENGQTEVLT